MKRAILIPVALLVLGCAGNPAEQSATAELPVSEQAPVGDAQLRAKAHTDLGMLYYQSGNTGVAIQEAKLALEADGNYAPAHNLLGLIHMFLNESLQAQASFEQARRIAPGDPEIANNYGLFLCQGGREREAIELFTAAARNPLYKTPTRPLTNAGLCALRMKDDKSAEDYFQRAAMADGANAQAIYHLSSLSLKKGDLYNARKYLGEVHRLMEPNAESLWLGVRIERKLGDRQAEASYASQLRRKFAGTPEHQALMQGKYE